MDEIDRIIGLEIGADDYVCKPYSPRELVARVKVQLRKKQLEDLGDEIFLNDDLTPRLYVAYALKFDVT